MVLTVRGCLTLIVCAIAIVTVECRIKITDLKVPAVVEAENDAGVTLDCIYDLGHDENDHKGLVVKWFYNDKELIYQWIPGHAPQALHLLKGLLNLNYKASDNPNKMYRALDIVNVNVNMSGSYTCSISTYLDEDKATKTMIIFDKEEEFRLSCERIDDHTVEIICSAVDIYPMPNITIYDDDEAVMKTEQENITRGEDGLYDISTSVRIEIDDAYETFTCELRIPDANYIMKKQIDYSGTSIVHWTKWLLVSVVVTHLVNVIG